MRQRPKGEPSTGHAYERNAEEQIERARQGEQAKRDQNAPRMRRGPDPSRDNEATFQVIISTTGSFGKDPAPSTSGRTMPPCSLDRPVPGLLETTEKYPSYLRPGVSGPGLPTYRYGPTVRAARIAGRVWS